MTSPATTHSWTAINQPRRRSILEPPPAPTRRPYTRLTYAQIPTIPPPRDHTTHPTRSLILPTPPSTPSAFTLPEPVYIPPRRPCHDLNEQCGGKAVSLWWERTLPHEPMITTDPAEYVNYVRRLDTIPMFRLSDLCNIRDSPIAQTYVVDRLQTPGYAPYSIADMLNSPESPESPASHADTSKQNVGDDFESDDADEAEFWPSTPIPTLPHPPMPPTTTVRVTLERRSSLGIGPMVMKPTTRPSSLELPSRNRANDPACVSATQAEAAIHGSAGTRSQRQSITEGRGGY
ncbi:hypothetical protein BST61_g4694 [Cercospora zeina]